jgi:hypothetical protein
VMRKHIKILSIAIFLITALITKTAQAQTVDYKAYTLFVYNFMKYVEWPDSEIKEDFVIGVIGDSPVIKELNQLASSKKIKGKNIVVKKFKNPDEIVACNLLYVSSDKSSQMKIINEKMKSLPVLIVAEREGLAKKGAAINFITLEDDTLKFEINKNSIEQKSLKVSSSLLALGISL